MNSNVKTRVQHVIAAALFILVGIAGTASAQWVNLRLAGTPRTPDGKPNLTAPVPKTADGKPDLSGIWRIADREIPERYLGGRYSGPLHPRGASAL